MFILLFVGQRLCIDFSISRANFLIALCLHLNVTCSCYFGLVDLIWMLTIVIYIYIVHIDILVIVNNTL